MLRILSENQTMSLTQGVVNNSAIDNLIQASLKSGNEYLRQMDSLRGEYPGSVNVTITWK